MPGSYRELVRQSRPPNRPAPPSPEQELDSLLGTYQERTQAHNEEKTPKPDQIQALREKTIKELIPAFVELVEKYSTVGVSMHMDASDFLEGGREIKFEFGLGDFRMQLSGTVTTEAIAFHETRHSPEMQGELVSGPMLRLRGLTAEVFRSFICQRLALLVRAAIRRR